MILQTSSIFNNYFAPTGKTIGKRKTYSNKHRTNEDSSTIFLQTTVKKEIAKIISSLPPSIKASE